MPFNIIFLKRQKPFYQEPATRTLRVVVSQAESAYDRDNHDYEGDDDDDGDDNDDDDDDDYDNDIWWWSLLSL